MDEDFFRRLKEDARIQHLRFLVVGGHAVNAYGYSRMTLDADLMISVEDLAEWRVFWESAGYRCIHETDAFSQFRSVDEKERVPLDLLLVTGDTFDRMEERGQKRMVGGVELLVPDPLHIIALKLHALRNAARAREGKDLQDIVELVRNCDLDVQSAEFQDILNRYGTEAVRSSLYWHLSRES